MSRDFSSSPEIRTNALRSMLFVFYLRGDSIPSLPLGGTTELIGLARVEAGDTCEPLNPSMWGNARKRSRRIRFGVPLGRRQHLCVEGPPRCGFAHTHTHTCRRGFCVSGRCLVVMMPAIVRCPATAGQSTRRFEALAALGTAVESRSMCVAAESNRRVGRPPPPSQLVCPPCVRPLPPPPAPQGPTGPSAASSATGAS